MPGAGASPGADQRSGALAGRRVEGNGHVAPTSQRLREQRDFSRESSTGLGLGSGPTCQLRSL